MKTGKKSTAKPKPDKDLMRELFRAILLPRMIEEKMLLLLRQGKVSKWFSGIGQEAIAVGATLALEADEWILPLHRNLGVFTSRQIPLWRLIAQWQGKAAGFTKGRDRSFHFGTREFHILGMISHLGPQLCVADGIALGAKLRREPKVTLVFSGDAGTSEGDFHEALNVAAVWNLPVIFLVENNGYGLSTPSAEQFRCKQLAERAAGYGMEGITIDGNDLLEVYSQISRLAQSIRKTPRPVLVECMTFRMRGHEEASGVKYVPKELIEQWGKRDPLIGFERRCLAAGALNASEIEAIRAEFSQYIDSAVEQAFALPDVEADTERELADLFAPYSPQTVGSPPDLGKKSKKRFIDAISDGLRAGMHLHRNLILMGQDIAEYGGVFKVTEGFLDEFGAERVRNTPLCESAILGAGLGLSVKGYKSVIEMQFADFVSSGFNPIVNNLAKTHYRWGQNADVVVRMPTGAGTSAGPFHSQSNEAWFFHTAGLKVVYPSNPYDAKGLLLSAIADPNPVMYFEHKLLYRSVADEIPDAPYNVPIGEARVLRAGSQATVITYGMGVHWAQKLQEQQPDLDLYILDLRTLAPLDYLAIRTAVAATNRVLILHEDSLIGGIGAEVAAWIARECFQLLDAPVMRSASLDTPVPFCAALERNFLPQNRFERDLEELLNF